MHVFLRDENIGTIFPPTVNTDDLTELQNSNDSSEQLVVDTGDLTPLPDSQPELKSTDSPAAEHDITMDDSIFLDDDDTTHST
ncbi:hypothetical protein G6F37_012227 [Rhizopus arrhizus]|nr:hypothetical protein G6F38_012130 [Rhizopus arrhizus]KAG1144927.1 hypothetical protein G6F37_012227 [Rhizopus arrhizus]